MEEKDDRREKNKRIELVLVGFLFLFGIGGIVMGIYRLQDAIQGPFRPKNQPEEYGSLLDGVDRGGVDIEGLKAKDTDGDGLNDYQEIYVLQTSQYLQDTDGDGITDKDELARGSDPNCPEGKNCFGKEAVVHTPINTALPPSQSDALDSSKAQNGSDPSKEINQVLQQFQNKTPQQIREFLKDQGIPEDQLSKIPDALLQAMYSQGIDQAVKQIKERGITPPQNSAPTPNAATSADPSRLTPQEIRTLLERSGKVPLDILQKVPDSTLKDMYLKAVQSTVPQQPQKQN